ncbi:unnamed protein product, partial [Polarella glacialis]
MVKCIQDNRAAKGGCCNCDSGWSGWRCRDPLCWPIIKHGTCIAPNLGFCDPGWKGEACSHAICVPECVPGQGTCVLPNTCECFYGWEGDACERPSSVPKCVNGDAVSPDICKCTPGWGGRLCDYPLCQSWPLPTSDCGYGSCKAPYSCECEPGWGEYMPVNGSGYDIPPFWSKGQDISQQTMGSYVMGDSRIAFLTFWDRQYNSSNAARCAVPDCSHIFDPRCTRCSPPPGVCTLCEPSFFVNTTTNRCERCSNFFPHCQICGPTPTGPDGKIVLRCTHCEPLYVLEPMPYGMDPSGRCISDGIIEFSSAVYHAYKDEQVVNLVVQRSIWSLDPAFAHNVEVIVRTQDGTAHSRSQEYGGSLASFEFTVTNVSFGVQPGVMMPTDGPGSRDFSGKLRQRFQENITLPIRIYDDVEYKTLLRYFDVELVLPPEHVMGHQGPLYPFVSLRGQETSNPWKAPQNFYRAPLLERQDVLSKTRVYLWDRHEATAVNTTCQGMCLDWKLQTLINVPRPLTITARTHEGTLSSSYRNRFLVRFVPKGVGLEDAIGTTSEAKLSSSTGIYTGEVVPSIPGPYKVIIDKAIPGILGEYFWHRGVHRNPPQMPDTTRVDHKLDFYWDDLAHAPAFARWQFTLHFECIRTARWPYNFAHALGIVSSPGTEVKIFFWNDKAQEFNVPAEAVPMPRESYVREDCMRETPLPYWR